MTPHNFPARALESEYEILDPGSGGVIKLTRMFQNVALVTAAAEARTVPAPAKAGLIQSISMRTDGGDATVTFTGGFLNASGAAVSTATFTAVGNTLLLLSVRTSATAFKFIVLANSGATLA